MSDNLSQSDWHDDEEEYGLTERQIAFKRLAAHALVDPEFYARLRDDPEAAVAEMYIQLREDDFRYLREIVEWKVLDAVGDEVRKALHTEAVIRSIW